MRVEFFFLPPIRISSFGVASSFAIDIHAYDECASCASLSDYLVYMLTLMLRAMRCVKIVIFQVHVR
jgi:hypothetical protein